MVGWKRIGWYQMACWIEFSKPEDLSAAKNRVVILLSIALTLYLNEADG